MQAARRLYLYLMSGITLAVIATGLAILLRVVLRDVFPQPDFEFTDPRQQLSQAIAMLGVGIPVWAVHWWLIQRGLRSGRPDRDAERGSGERAIYLSAVLLVSLVYWVSGAIALLAWAATDVFNISTLDLYLDPLGSATAAVVGLAVWIYHGSVRRGDLAAGPVSGPAASIPRGYLYGVSIGALFVAVSGLNTIVQSLLLAPSESFDDGYQTFNLVRQAITVGAWGVVWLGHWLYARRLVADPGWRGVDERISRARVGAYVIVIAVAAVMTLVFAALAISAALRPLLPDPGFPIEADTASIVSPLLTAVPWAIVWFLHVRWLRQEPAASDPARALHQERLVSHAISGAALAIGATGAGWLVGYAINLLFGGASAGSGTWEPFELAQWLPLAVVGLPVWWWFWRRVVRRRHLDPEGEASSTIRRTFLYLTLGVALVVAIAAAGAILYRFVGGVVGAGLGGNLASELAAPLGSLIVAALVLLYHGLQLRRDQALVAAAEARGAAPADAAAAVTSAVDASAVAVASRRPFELVGPAGADLDAALAAARAALPPGIEIVSSEA